MHDSTGYSPNFLMFGRECYAPVDLVLGVSGEGRVQWSTNEYIRDLQGKILNSLKMVREQLKGKR